MSDALEIRKDVLREIFIDIFYNSNNQEVLTFCPKHHHRKKKLSININKNFFKCWVCGYSGKKITNLLYEYGNANQRKRYFDTLGYQIKEITTKTFIELPKEYKFLLTHKNSPGGMMAYAYLKNIGIDDKTILKNKIGYCEDGYYNNRIIFPSFDSDGKINFFSTRRFDDNDYKKYLHCTIPKSEIVYNELFVNYNKPIILVEGIKTQLKHSQIPNIVPVLGSKINEEYKIFQDIILRDCPMVYICFDKDAENSVYNLMNKFASHRVETRMVKLEEQADEVSTSKFVEAIKKSKKISNEDYINNLLRAV